MMKFSLNASEVMMEKTIKGSRLPALLLKTEEDALTLINDISSLNPITKMFISRVVDSIKKKIGIKDIMKKGDSINEER